MLRTAERKKAKLKIGLSGPSGSGKTYSAILLASGMASSFDKIALIDTENGRGELYSELGGYQYMRITAPFTPEKYINAITECEKAGMEVIIVDSISQEWEGAGGCLEINETIAGAKYRGNSWAAWNEVTPRHRNFIDKIIQADAHIITTVRNKIDTMQTEDKKVKKVGIKEITREGFEYELTINFNIDRDTHLAIPSKDNTNIFENNSPHKISKETGEKIIAWNNGGLVNKVDETIDKPKTNPAINQQKKVIKDLAVKLNGKEFESTEKLKSFVENTAEMSLVEENYLEIVRCLELLLSKK